MKTSIHCKSFSPLPHHLEFAEREVNLIVGKFEGSGEIRTDVTLRRNGGEHRISPGDDFACEIRLRGGSLGREYFVHKASVDLESAIRHAARAAAKILRRNARRQTSRRRLISWIFTEDRGA